MDFTLYWTDTYLYTSIDNVDNKLNIYPHNNNKRTSDLLCKKSPSSIYVNNYSIVLITSRIIASNNKYDLLKYIYISFTKCEHEYCNSFFNGFLIALHDF